MKYKDLQNKVHDIEDGFQYMMPNFPQNYVRITDEEAAQLLAPPPLTLSERKQAEIDALELAYDTATHEPISYLNTTFQADKDSQQLITDVLVAAGFNMPLGFMWRDSNNVATLVEGNLLHGLAQAILMRAQPLFWAKSAKKDAINACLTVEELDLYLNPPVIPPEEPLP